MADKIKIKGARENNLQNIDLTIPRDKLVVLTGLSGSGKSSLAFDTIYAEGQRRYVESLSSYARQFLGQMDKPDVDYIEGLSPAISIDQKTTSRNPRSTVGTVTEIYDYLRLMYARIGVPHCPICGREISSQSVDQIVDTLMAYGEGTKLTVMAPVIRDKKGTHEKIISRIRRDGFTRVRVDGEMYRIDEDEIKMEKSYRHSIDIVVDRVKVREGAESRLAEAAETAIQNGAGLVRVEIAAEGFEGEKIFSTKFACPEHGSVIEELEPRMFSFNSPFGACEECKGLGFIESIEPELIIPDETKSINEGALSIFYSSMEFKSFYKRMVAALAEDHGVSLDTPYSKLPKKFKKELLYGTNGRNLKYSYLRQNGQRMYREHPFEGLVTNLERRYRKSDSEMFKEWLMGYMSVAPCEACGGRRLKPEVLAVTVGGLNIAEFCDMPVKDELEFMDNLDLTDRQRRIGDQIIKEIRARLQFLVQVGLDYLTMSRAAATLSGGESQRIRLATQIGSGLVGVLYILDEPSIGLHQKDNAMLLDSLRSLTDAGNTLLVVEHDEETMYAADQIIDIGPGAGRKGGRVVAQGTVEDIKQCEESVTGQYLSGRRKIEIPLVRRPGNGKNITIKGAKEHNLRDITVKIPLGKFVCVTGVSGSGKSSLVNEILYKGLAKKLNRASVMPGEYKSMLGTKNIDKVINIDQSPIG
ncbi:MAG: excinuclease ABC subunit UvrA, partial [Anaerovoracaceae bacterium]|nr:excinuclease ABC subunit UvrA [Anaerovoracaceae bacterium]